MIKRDIKTNVCIILAVFVLLSQISAYAIEVLPEDKFDLPVKSAVLMDYNTGTVIYSMNETEPMSPASVTKIMTLLLVMEEIEKGNMTYEDMITVSDYAASMGGSQVFLEAGESMRAEDLIISIIISSGNDAAVAMAEAVAGSEKDFVSRMNEKANTCF